MRRFLAVLGSLVLHPSHAKWIIYGQVLLALVCGLYTARELKLDMNRDNLIGARLKSHQIYLQFRQEFPGEDDLVAVVESASPERNRQFIERLGARVQPETNLFSDLLYKSDLASLGPKALLLVPAKDLESLRQSLHSYLPFIREFGQATNLVSLFAAVNGQFRNASPRGGQQTEALIEALPLLRRILMQAQQSLLRPGQPPPPGISGFFAGGSEAEQQVYVTLEGGRIYLLTVRPAGASVTGRAIERLRQLIRATQEEVPGVAVGLTGGPVLDYDEMLQSERDTTVASVAALIICSLIFITAYRQLERPLKAALGLLIGLGYTMGFTTLAVGHLNILTITFVPMLIGLAIDFGVHFISRYEEEMRNRRPQAEAMNKAMVFTGQGIVTGGLTTAAAFLAMALTNFKGIREMGLISGSGLLLCLVPMMTALPALLLQGKQNLRDHQIGPAGQARLGLEKVWLQHPGPVLLVTLLLCVLGGLAIPKVYFDYNLLHLQSKGLNSVVYEDKLLKAGETSTIFGAVVADSAPQAQAYEQRLKQLPAVARVESMAPYFTEDQRQKLDLVRAIKEELARVPMPPLDPGPINLPELSATLWYLAGYVGLAAEQAQPSEPALARQLRLFRETLDLFRKTLLSDRPQIPAQLRAFQQALFKEWRGTLRALQTQDTSGPLRPQDLPRALRDRFIGVTGKFLLQVYPRKDIWQRENQREFIQQLESVVPPDRVTGTPVELYNYTRLLKLSYQQAAWYSLGAIVLMVWLHFRSLMAVVLSLVPVGVGAIWLLGLMGWAGIPFNPANIMTLPLVVGIGVTNGIQVLNRFAEEGSPGVLAKSTGKAVLVSGLTAITGFGTLIFARHQGIRSLGELMAAGIAACMVAGLTVLPALLSLLMRSRWSWGLRAHHQYNKLHELPR